MKGGILHFVQTSDSVHAIMDVSFVKCKHMFRIFPSPLKVRNQDGSLASRNNSDSISGMTDPNQVGVWFSRDRLQCFLKGLVDGPECIEFVFA